MDHTGRVNHWEKIYQTKQPDEVSWYQPTPETSLSFFGDLNIPKDAKIMDAGGGDSLLVDHLLDLGYTDVTVLDISAAALERAKKRLGVRADKVKWIQADIAEYIPDEAYDVWHDRAAFHFLTDTVDINHYLNALNTGLKPNGVLIVGTFSDKGPLKCSGLEIRQYTEESMSDRLSPFFNKIRCITLDHLTPFNTLQNFIFCSFRKPVTA